MVTNKITAKITGKTKLLYTYFMMQFMLFLSAVTTLNDSRPYYCFSHYFNDTSLVTVFKQ